MLFVKLFQAVHYLMQGLSFPRCGAFFPRYKFRLSVLVASVDRSATAQSH